MEILYLWLTTIVISKLIRSTNNSLIYKKLMDEGYKPKVGVKINSDTKWDFIPFVNISINLLFTLFHKKVYEEVKGKLKESNSLVELTSKEKEEYNEIPTIQNAVNLSKRRETVIKSFEIKGCIVTYEVDYRDNIKVLSLSGDMRNVSEMDIAKAIMLSEMRQINEFEEREKVKRKKRK